MKKLFAIMLATLMLMSVAMPIFAETTADGVFKVGTQTYATFKDAYDAVEDGGTIVMLKDYYAGTKEGDAPKTGEAQISVTKSFTLTTENGAKYTYSNAKREDSGLSNFVMHINADGKTVKIENINFDVARGINVTKGTLELTNSSITANRRTAIKADGGVNSTIKLHNSVLKTTSECTGSDTAKQEPPVLLNNTQSVNFIATGNSKIIRASGNNSGGNASVINVAGAGKTEITIGSGVQLVLDHGVNGTKNDACGIYLGGSGLATVTLESGSAMYANTTLPNLKFLTGSQSVSFTDKGCNYFVSTSLTTTPMPWSNGVGDVYNFNANASADVSGYKAYKADCTKGEAYFSYIGENDAQNTASTLSAAIALAKSGSVITLLKNYTSDQNNLSLTKPLELDLNGKTYTGTKSKAYLFGSIKANFTIKNGTMTLERGFIVHNGGNLLLDNVTMTGASGVLLKLNGAGTPKATINNSTITQNTTGEDIVLAEQKCDGELNLTGNTVLKYAGGINGNAQNCGIIAVQNAWGTNIDSKAVTSNTDLVLNVGSGVTLWAAHASSTTATHVAAVIADQSYGNIIVNIEKGATIKIDRTPGASKTAFVNEIFTTTEGNADGKTIVNDDGAKFIIGADVAKKGIALPASIFGYTDGTNVIKDTTYSNADATEAVTLTKVALNIKMNKGASIRTALPMGIRFGASIDAAQYQALLALDPNATLGFAIAKSNVAGEKFNVSTLKTSDYKIYDARHLTLNEEAGVYTFNTTMYEGEELFERASRTNLVRDYSARAFIKLTIDGEEVYYWADFNEAENSRSIFYVAKAYYETGATTDVVINHILKTCGYEA